MVFGHNLQHLAPFGIPTSGFCMVFQYESFIFSTSGAILGPQDLDLGSSWAVGTNRQKWGPGKHDFVEEMVPHEVLWESVRGDWIVWYPGGVWAGPFPPKHSEKIVVQGFPAIPGVSGCLLYTSPSPRD